jgi:DNA-binding transcriptional LysR family regulator
VLESVEQGQADIGIVSYPRSTRTIEAEPWREEPIVLACAPGHPLAGRVQISLGELHGQRMVSFDPDLVIRHELDRALAANGAEPVVVMEFDNIETIKRAVEIDAGVALLPEPSVGRELAAGTLCCVRIAGEELVRPLGIIRARGKPLGPTARRFVDLLHGHARDTDADLDAALTAHA